ncbi:TonB-dependent receptor [Olivibacter sp. SDN3]|uniref:SusC/RagA family TonB-linked outer membrane protein n=1 Tax=Olivibacter sp. SDN3 TaxID=2764720 RepID=UPI001650E556|nr:TonB-dependent receptor [Olivibacter sp. SDN3]QNL50478.1 TonB-dependent receptor [Olivibacter sp. SDN3]
MSCFFYVSARMKFLLLFAGLLAGSIGYAQQSLTVSGTVTDNQGPIEGVSVLVQGSKQGAKTDQTGSYQLETVKGARLTFTFVGYQDTTITVESQRLDVVLREASQVLEEVVISYGTQQRKEVTGAISQINATEMKDMPVGQFSQKLQNRIPGVQITQTTGRPGQGMNVRVRGSASMNASSNPLYVVDGQPVTGDINNINPDEIESFSVLKDASATALYGSRAANGVVLVTTKSGKGTEGVNVNFSAFGGVQHVPQRGRPDVMNAREFAQWQRNFYEDKIRYENWTNPATGLAEIPDDYANPEQYGEGTDWYGVLLRQGAPIQNYSLSLTSNTEKFSSAVTAGYMNQQGVLHNTGYQRFSFRANNEYRPTEKLTLGFNIAPTLQLDHNTLTNTDGQRQVIDGGFITSPISPAINEDGSLPLTANTFGMFPNPNWYRVLGEKLDDYKRNRILGNIFGEYQILDGLKFKTRADIDVGAQTQQLFVSSTSGGGLFVAPPQLATGQYNTQTYYSWLNENVLTYNKSIGDHTFDLLAGYTTQKYRQENSGINKTDFPNDQIPWLDAAATVTEAGSNTQAWSLESLIGRVNYSFKGRYLLSAAVRRDGSSRFGSDRRWGTFPSVSVGWVASDESFLQEQEKISFLKVRASYGLVGNNNIGNYTSIAMMGPNNYVFGGSLVQGLAINSLGNTLLSWETTKQFDAGLELGLWDDRINLIYDYYYKKTDGMLYPVELPRASGFTEVFTNIGAFKFWGHEIGISTKNLTGELTWNTDFNITFNRNEVLQLGTNDTPIGGFTEQGDFNRTAVGQPIGQFYGYIYDGVYMTQEEFDTQPKHSSSQVGTVRMKDINGDGVIDMNDRTFIGDPNPDFIFGLTNSFRYRNWDLSFLIAGSVGGQTMAATYENIENLDGVFNVRKEMLNGWRSLEDPGNGEVPRTLSGTTELYRFTNSRWVYDASYVSLRNITLGRSFEITNSNYLKNIRVYASIQEALMLTKYPGMNPEVANNEGDDPLRLGVDQTTYPIPRTFTFGVNVGF